MKICSTLTPKGNALNVRGICGHIRTVFGRVPTYNVNTQCLSPFGLREVH